MCYSGKVICVKRGFDNSTPLADITIGKVYTITDGIITIDDGYKSNRYRTLEEICYAMGHEFIPLVE